MFGAPISSIPIGVGHIARRCLIRGESASARTHCVLGPHASCPASQANRVRIDANPFEDKDPARPDGPAPRSQEALPPEPEGRLEGRPTVKEGGRDPVENRRADTVHGRQHSAAAAATAAAASGRSTLSAREMAPPEQSDVSEYEKQRMQNIRENKAKLAALGIPDAKPTPKAKRKAPVYTSTVTEPARKSARAAVPSQGYSDAIHSRSPSHRRRGASSSAASGGHAPARSVSGAGEEWGVEAILKQRAGGAGEIEYLVKWQQWTEEHNTCGSRRPT